MSETDLVALYSGALLELAANIPHTGQLSAPQGRAKRRSPLCGSSVAVDVTLENGVIVDFAQDVRACALGQASAAVFGAGVLGRRADEISALRASVAAMLVEKAPPPAAPFEGYAYLAAAREFPNRHASILLVLDATCAALEAAGASGTDRRA